MDGLHLSPEALASMVKMSLDETLAGQLAKGFAFQPAEITVQMRMDPKVPGGIAIHATGRTQFADPTKMANLEARCREWLTSGDTGTSSETIFHVMMGTPGRARKNHSNWPHDVSDFGRCYRLLERFPEWVERMPEVAQAFPGWGPMVEAWPDLMAFYKEEMGQRNCVKTWERMKPLREACMIAEGWVQTGPGSWELKK